MLLDDRHRDIARVALAAAGRKYGVAFAGGGALQVHDVSSRRTQDVDLFVRREKNVARAVPVITAALENAGYWVETTSSYEGHWELQVYPYPPEHGWTGSGPYPHPRDSAPEAVQVEVSYFAYSGTVAKDIGPVVELDYLAARKAVAIMERHQVRDYVDIAQLADGGYTVEKMIKLAFEENPALVIEDAEEVGAHLDDNISDKRLAAELPPGKTPAWVRGVFEEWPRPAPGSAPRPLT